ncbi:MAG TPA: DUF2934 domain-containing protein [bacterium]|jgi:hypothetical protein|nr:DUF2934 domain-containing protein [bacterium]
MNATSKSGIKPTRDEIAARAYQLWEKDGRKAGQDSKYWFQAENELRMAQISASSAINPPARGTTPTPRAKTTNHTSRARATA